MPVVMGVAQTVHFSRSIRFRIDLHSFIFAVHLLLAFLEETSRG